MKLTTAEFRALQAVDAGKVLRIYRTTGNILRGPQGMSANTLWRLDQKGLIHDGDRSWGVGATYCVQCPTAAGRLTLDSSGQLTAGGK